MKCLSYVLALAIVICGLSPVDLAVQAVSADITGTWELTIHYPPPSDPYTATYVLKQNGEKVTGTYHGLHGPADVTGTIKGNDLTLSVTVQSLTTVTANFTGKVTSATKMNGTVTGTDSSGEPMPWSAEKKK